jgi:hypothetical protein
MPVDGNNLGAYFESLVTAAIGLIAWVLPKHRVTFLADGRLAVVHRDGGTTSDQTC